MRDRKCQQKRKRSTFGWDEWLGQNGIRNENRPDRNESLVLQFLGYLDGKNLDGNASVNVDIYLTRSTTNNNNINDNQKQLVWQLIRKSDNNYMNCIRNSAEYNGHDCIVFALISSGVSSYHSYDQFRWMSIGSLQIHKRSPYPETSCCNTVPTPTKVVP